MDLEEVDKVVEKIEETIKGFEGKVVETNKLGRKKLAYDIENYRDGFFVVQNLEIPADKIVSFKRQLKLNDNILRTMFIEASRVKA